MRIAAIEAGGTKFVCAVVELTEDGHPAVAARRSIPTVRPEETIADCAAFFEAERARAGEPFAGLGIGSFGPVDLNPDSPRWGYITSTPKPFWRDTDLAGALGRALGLPVWFDTDVGAAALGEGRWGAARGLADYVYVTVGTGIGGGIVSGGAILHGAGHPEIGHLRVGRIEGDRFAGVCPFHGDCLEGLAAGPAIGARWGGDARDFGDGHTAWDLEARYLARGFASLMLTLAPRRIIVGGGVGLRPGLVEAIRPRLREELAGYLQNLDSDDAMDALVVRASLGANAGILGCAALALSRPLDPGRAELL